MKALKLSLVAALAVGSFSALNAKPLEEAIKNVDLSGELRYRYDSSTARKAPQAFIGAGVAGNQDHRFRARFGAKADIGDGFKIFGQIHYDNDKNRGFGDPASAGQGRTQTGNPFALRQAYLQYDMADYGLNFIWGRQELGTIWTDDFVGTAALVASKFVALLSFTHSLCFLSLNSSSLLSRMTKEFKSSYEVLSSKIFSMLKARIASSKNGVLKEILAMSMPIFKAKSSSFS